MHPLQPPSYAYEAGKVTVGLATHWPHVRDFVVYQPTVSKAYVRNMGSPPTPTCGYDTPLRFK